MSLVSVVMPTYNSQKWVGPTIDSLIAQTYGELELIVVDDGSQDETVAYLEEKLKEEFRQDWRIIRVDGNRGPSGARNIGTAAARGDWVQFLDSDDFLSPQKLELQMAHCSGAAAEVVAVYSPWRQCRVDDGEVIPIGTLSSPEMNGRAPIMCLVGNDRPLHSAGLARRTALERIGGFDERLRFWECEEVTFRLAKTGRLESVPSPAPLYLWRQHPERPYLGGEEARYRTTDVALSWIELVLDGLGRKPLSELDLSANDRRDILSYSTYWARLLFRQDRPAFHRYLALARQLDPDLSPAYPAAISVLGRRIGYEAAESVASLARPFSALAREFRRKLRPTKTVSA